RQTLRKTAATKSTDHYQLVARATKDAIRDWDLTSGALTWPQGLDSLLGYSPSGSGQTIAFWQQQIHRDDRSRIAASIREAIKSQAEHWSGEYRFRHAKGHYLHLLERALLVRDKNGRAAERAASLTRQLLTFSRREPLEPRILEVNTLIHNLERSILRLLGENISVLCELMPEKKHIKVDPDQFTQIIINLAVNARDAMPAGGTLVLKTETISTNGKSLPELPSGKYVRISVIDNGMGMSEEVKEHLFEPFFSTKGDPHGSGLGLATCYGIARQSGGHITVESELAKGTAVYIYLPEVAAPPPAGYRKRPKLPSGTETILVVEDDISVRHVAVRTLRLLGYNVLEAFRADEAKRLIEN